MPTADEGVARVNAGQLEAYEQTLAGYGLALETEATPARAVERCRFIAQFADEEYNAIERAPSDLEACIGDLQSRWPEDANVRLFVLDRRWGEEAVALGEPWLEGADAWPASLRRQLFAQLSQAYQDDDDFRSGELAVRAAELGDPERVASAVEHLLSVGEGERALGILREAPPATAAWTATRRVRAALELPDRSAALAELRRYEGSDIEIMPAVAARACLRAGEIECARQVLDATESGNDSDELKAARFDVAFEATDMVGAAGQIDIAGGTGLPMAMQRFAMVVGQAPRLLLEPNLMILAVVFAMMLFAMALLPLLVLLPVHYRGLARRVRGKVALPPFAAVGLRHAWLGGALMLCLPLLVALVAAPGSVAMLFGGTAAPGQDDMMRLTLGASVLGLLLLAPIAYRIGWRRLTGDAQAWRNNWWRVLAAVGLLLLVSTVLGRMHAGEDTSTLQTRMVETLIDGGARQYGTPLVLLVVAVLVPIYEELVFRGLLLGGMARHISFGWANVIQATLFALAHGDSPRFLFYLVLGLLSGWLVRKSNALGPSIAVHATNNALVTLLRIAFVGR